MKTMGIRELKEHMSEVLKDVQAGETIEITNHGAAVAMLIPIRRRPNEAEIEASLASLDALAAEIGRYVTEPTDVATMISEMRR